MVTRGNRQPHAAVAVPPGCSTSYTKRVLKVSRCPPNPLPTSSGTQLPRPRSPHRHSTAALAPPGWPSPPTRASPRLDTGAGEQFFPLRIRPGWMRQPAMGRFSAGISGPKQWQRGGRSAPCRWGPAADARGRTGRERSIQVIEGLVDEHGKIRLSEAAGSGAYPLTDSTAAAGLGWPAWLEFELVEKRLTGSVLALLDDTPADNLGYLYPGAGAVIPNLSRPSRIGPDALPCRPTWGRLPAGRGGCEASGIHQSLPTSPLHDRSRLS